MLRLPGGRFTYQQGVENERRYPAEGASNQENTSCFCEQGTHRVEPSRGRSERILSVNRCPQEQQELDSEWVGQAADSLTDEKCACKLTRCCRVATGHCAPQGILAEKLGDRTSVCPASEVEQVVERVSNSSENCGKVHDKTTSAKCDGGIVRGGSVSARPDGGERTDAPAPAASTTGACH